MDLSYDLDSTTIEVTEQELDDNHTVIERAAKEERRAGRKVTVLVRLEIHEANDRQVELAPLGRIFPRPLKRIGASVPVIIVDKLKELAEAKGQPLSDVTRVLYTEFLIAKKRKARGDGWAAHIERQLDEVKSLRESKKRISYARTKQQTLRPKKRSSNKKSTKKKASKKKATRRR